MNKIFSIIRKTTQKTNNESNFLEHVQPVNTVSERDLINRMNKEDKNKLLESYFLDNK